MADVDTGERWELTEVNGTPARRSPPPPLDAVDWATVYLPQLAQLADFDDLSGAEARVLLRLMAQAPLGECQRINQLQLAARLRIHRHTVARALTSLIERGVVVNDPDESGCYWVNPDLFWRGRRDEVAHQRRRLADA